MLITGMKRKEIILVVCFGDRLVPGKVILPGVLPMIFLNEK